MEIGSIPDSIDSCRRIASSDDSSIKSILLSTSTTGVAVLTSYGFTDNLKLAGRIEYLDSTGKGATPGSSTNLFLGPGSSAWSFTITPTFQYNIFYARAEYSIVTASSTTPGFAFGPNGTAKDQNRFAVEAGVLF